MLIGHLQRDHVRLEILDRPFADEPDHYGRNLLRGMVHVAAGPFQGGYRIDVYAWEFEALREALRALDASGQGAAALEDAESGLAVEFSADGPDHCLVRCVARDVGVSGARLEFEVQLDRAELPMIVRDLDALLRAFPVIRGG
jgi:hypothetical protein